jgi:ATP/ADP translocase
LESKSIILKLLNIEKSEVKYVLWTILYSFFLGTAIAYFFTGSTSLFLNIFDREMISLSFIIAGIIVIVIGQVYSLVQKKFHFSFTVVGALAFLLISVLAFFVLFSVFKSIILIFALYAWNRVIAYIHNVVFWGMAGKLFSIQQSKRILGLITGGEVIGLIVAFFSIPVLLKVVSTEDLILISGITLVLGFIILLIITKKFSVELDSAVKKKVQPLKQTKAKKTSFLQNRYYRLFFVIAFAPILAQFFVDYLFQAQAKVEYPSKEALTAFVGIFFGFSAIVEFVLKTFISGRLMSRYGMKLGLLAFPVVMAISLVLATLFGFIYGAVSLFFSFIALGRMFTRAVRASFNDPATQLLYQPIPAEERMSFQNKVESGPKAYGSIVAGILLLGFAKIPGMNLVYVSLFLLIVTIFWALSSKEIYKEYRTMLQKMLSLKKNNGTKDNNHPLIQEIIGKINQDKITDAKLISKLARVIIPSETDKLIEEYPQVFNQHINGEQLKFSEVIELSKSEKASERIISLRQMHKYSIYKIEKPLIRLLHDEDYDVKCEAIIAAAKIKETELFYHLVTLFQNPEYKTITAGVMVNLGQAILPDLDHNFQKTEYDIALQLDTIDVIEKLGGENVIEFLKRNVDHHNKVVSDRAILALRKLNYKTSSKESMLIWQKIENEIKNYVFVCSAIINLKGKIESQSLFNSLEKEKKEKKIKIFTGLSVLYDPFAISLIADSLESEDKNSRGFAVEVADLVISDLHKPSLLPLLESHSDEEMAQKYMLYYPTEKLDVLEQLVDIINSEYWVTGLFLKATALKLLSSINDKRVLPILHSNIVHPRPIMWQLAAFCIYKLDNNNFKREIRVNFPKVNGLQEFANEIEAYTNGAKYLIYERLHWLKSHELLNDIPEDELIDIATNLRKHVLDKDDCIIIDKKTRYYILIIDGVLKEVQSGKTFCGGEFSCPLIQFENDRLEFISDATKTTFILIDMYLIDRLLIKYPDFCKKMTGIFWKDSQDIPVLEEM